MMCWPAVSSFVRKKSMQRSARGSLSAALNAKVGTIWPPAARNYTTPVGPVPSVTAQWPAPALTNIDVFRAALTIMQAGTGPARCSFASVPNSTIMRKKTVCPTSLLWRPGPRCGSQRSPYVHLGLCPTHSSQPRKDHPGLPRPPSASPRQAPPDERPAWAPHSRSARAPWTHSRLMKPPPHLPSIPHV